MSHLLFILALAFIAWRWSRRLRPKKDIRPDADRPGSPLAASTDDDDDEVEETDVAGLVSNLFGAKGQDLIDQAVERVIRDSRAGAGREYPQAIEPIVKALSSARPKARDQRRVKYLLDSDAGYRQRTDRTARLEQSFRGKGLCSPRQATNK
ncbi:hypothetical protein ACVDG8_004780 [Mesorhizobium sp. ORM8.1]